jgi:hypothetical protein
MPTQTLAPDAILASTGLSGAVSDVQDDPASPDANWIVYDGATNNNTDIRLSFPTPSGTLTSGAGLQTFRAWIRRNNTLGNTVSYSLQLWENGAQVGAALATGNVTTTTGELISGTWDASTLAASSGADVEIRIQQTAGGNTGGGTGHGR